MPCATNKANAVLPAGSVLVAHRGDAAHHPENTLAAFVGAAGLGVRHVELDVQITRDGTPIVLHDATLTRTHGLDMDVTGATLRELGALGVLADGTRPPPVPRLAEFVDWMREAARMHVFVEIKKESLRAHGRKDVLAAVVQTIEEIRDRAAIISYDARVLAAAKRDGWSIGYVLPGLGRRYRAIAENLAPRFLFADYRQILRAGTLWPGNWEWAAFDLEDFAAMQHTARLGVRYLETMNPARYLGR